MGSKYFPYLGRYDMFLEISIMVIDELGRLEGMVYGPPTLVKIVATEEDATSCVLCI